MKSSLLVFLSTAACAPKATESSLNQARLEASESKIAQLEERLKSIESKTENLDNIEQGVQLLLQRLDDMGGVAPKKATPSPSAVYSMPIDGDPYIGPEFAKVTLVKGYDFYCGYCDKALPVMAELQSIYGADLKIVFKNFVIHDDYARLPALAACAAHKQNKFMPMFQKIWENGLRARTELDEPKLIALAKAIKLNQKRFLKDMYGTCEDKIQSDFKRMEAVGATGTPVFYINGRFLSGARPIEQYRHIIDQELQKADRVLQTGVKLKDYYNSIVATGRTRL